MSVDSRKKLTAFYDSGKVVVTSEFVNSMFGGLHGTSEGDMIASVDPNDPRIVGHLHDGINADGHAAKINLESHVKSKLRHINLGDGAVRKNNVQCYPEALKHNAIPEFEVDPDTGEKCYYLNLDLPSGGGEPAKPAGNDTEIQFNDGGEFGSQAGYVFKKEDVEGLKNGMMGINVQDIEQNYPYALSVFGDEQIYSDEILTNHIDLSIVFDGNWQKNWKIVEDGIFGIKKINDVIHFDSSFGRQAYIDHYNQEVSANFLDARETGVELFPGEYLAPDHFLRAYFGNDLQFARANLEVQGMDEAVAFINEVISSFPDPLPLDAGGSDVVERYKTISDFILTLIEKFKNFFNVLVDQEIPEPLYDYKMGQVYYNQASNLPETCGGVYQGGLDDHRNGNHPWSTDYWVPPDDPDEIPKYLIYWLISDMLLINEYYINRYSEYFKIIDDYNNLNRVCAKVYVSLETSAGRGTVKADRWYKLSYSVKTNVGSAKLSIPNVSRTQPRAHIDKIGYLSKNKIDLDTTVGNHHLYFKTNPCLKHIRIGGLYDSNKDHHIVPALLFEFISNSPGEIIELENLKLSELVEGGLYVSGTITGGGKRGIRLGEDNYHGLVGIGLTRSDYWKNSADLANQNVYERSLAERPQAELHIRGERGRDTYDPDNANDQNKHSWSTPIIIEDIPPCSWIKADGTEAFHNNIRGTLIIDDNGRVYVNEKIKCESAVGGAIQPIVGNQGEIIHLGSGGVLEADRAISIDAFNLANPVLRLVDSHEESNLDSFSSIDFFSAEDDGSGDEVTSKLAGITAKRDNLILLGEMSLNSPSPGFEPPDGMISIGGFNAGLSNDNVGLRVSSKRMVAIGDVESLHSVGASNTLTSVGLTNGKKYKITANPNGFDFTQFEADSNDVGEIFTYRGVSFPPEDPIFTDADAEVSFIDDGYHNRTLEVVSVSPGSPPVRITGFTNPTSQDFGPSLSVNSDGDIFKNEGGAQFMRAKLHSSVPTVSVGTPVVMQSWDPVDEVMVVATNGNGRAAEVSGGAAVADPSVGMHDTVVGVAAEAAEDGEIFNVQILGKFAKDMRIFVPGLDGMTPPAANDPSFVIPAGTPIRSFNASTFEFNTISNGTFIPDDIETFAVPGFFNNGSSKGDILFSPDRTWIGYLAEDIDLNIHLPDAQQPSVSDPTKKAGKKLIGALSVKVFIKPG